jgi:hypothetical protein
MLADPRRKDLVQPYTPQHLTPEEMPPDFIAMISLVFGLIGMIAQVMHKPAAARGFVKVAHAHSLPVSVVSLPCAVKDRKLAGPLCLRLLARQRQEVGGGHQADDVQCLVSDSVKSFPCLASATMPSRAPQSLASLLIGARVPRGCIGRLTTFALNGGRFAVLGLYTNYFRYGVAR